MKAVNSAKRKRVEEAMDLGQGDDRLPGTDRLLTDVAMVSPILMAEKNQPVTKPSNRTLTGATLEMEELEKNRRELDEMTKTMLNTEEDRDMWKRLFEDCNKKHG